MTENELNQLYWLNRETERLQKDLKDLEQWDGYNSPVLTGMPRGRKGKAIPDYAAEIADLREIINLNLHRIQRERARLERYIGAIPDAEIRFLIRLRHINCMGWEDIAAEMMILDDNGNVINSPHRSTIYRKYKKYLDAHIAHAKNL